MEALEEAVERLPGMDGGGSRRKSWQLWRGWVHFSDDRDRRSGARMRWGPLDLIIGDGATRDGGGFEEAAPEIADLVPGSGWVPRWCRRPKRLRKMVDTGTMAVLWLLKTGGNGWHDGGRVGSAVPARMGRPSSWRSAADEAGKMGSRTGAGAGITADPCRIWCNGIGEDGSGGGWRRTRPIWRGRVDFEGGGWGFRCADLKGGGRDGTETKRRLARRRREEEEEEEEIEEIPLTGSPKGAVIPLTSSSRRRRLNSK